MSEAAVRPDPVEPAARLWRYQAERFPLFKHGLLILVFSGGEVLYGSLLRGGPVDWRAVATAFVVALLLFFQLRVADEHKDFADDSRWRPERAVPRGLVGLRLLRRLAIGAAVIQLGLTLLFWPPLVGVLALVWGWMALMTAEFFAPEWLKARPILYLVSHMLVMPLIALFSVAAGARTLSLSIGPGLIAFLILAFLNGVVLEIGRKTWAPEQEREGVETYSRLWGPRVAAATISLAALAGVITAALAGDATGFPRWATVAFGVWGALTLTVVLFALRPTAKLSKALETMAGIYVLGVYVGLAWGPTISRLTGHGDLLA